MRGLRQVCLALGLVLLAAACGGGNQSSNNTSTGPYKLGFIASFSGNGASFLDVMYQSVQLAVKELNASNALGRPIVLITGDDASDPQTSQVTCTRMVLDQQVEALISWQNSADRAPCLPIAHRAGVPYIYATNYEGGVCDSYFFVDGPVPNQQIVPLVKYMSETQGSKKWYMFGSDYIFVHGGFDFAKAQISTLGGQTAGAEYTPFNTPDFSSPIQKIVQSGADTLLFAVIGADGIAFFKQWRATPGTEKIKIAAYTDPTGTTDTAKGIFYANAYFNTIDTPANKTYVANLNKMFADAAQVTQYGWMGYDGVNLWAQAVKKAGTTKGSEVIKALHDVSFDGPGGAVKFNSQGHAPLPMYIGVRDAVGNYKVSVALPPVDPSDQCTK